MPPSDPYPSRFETTTPRGRMSTGNDGDVGPSLCVTAKSGEVSPHLGERNAQVTVRGGHVLIDMKRAAYRLKNETNSVPFAMTVFGIPGNRPLIDTLAARSAFSRPCEEAPAWLKRD